MAYAPDARPAPCVAQHRLAWCMMARNQLPPTASSVWVEMPFMRGPVGAQRLREWLPVVRDNRAQTATRRQRVLAHEWAGKRLCLILSLKEARHWSGYIPPAKDEHGRIRANPVRQDLIALLRDVEKADNLAAEDFE